MARVLGDFPVLVVSKTGELKEARDLDAAVKAAVPEKDPRFPAVKAATDQELKPLATATNLLGRMQQEYSLGTGIWIGATLKQHAWVPLPLSMNGTHQGFIEHAVEVAFTRRLPCGPGMPLEGCVELGGEDRERAVGERLRVPEVTGSARRAQRDRIFDRGGFVRRRQPQ